MEQNITVHLLFMESISFQGTFISYYQESILSVSVIVIFIVTILSSCGMRRLWLYRAGLILHWQTDFGHCLHAHNQCNHGSCLNNKEPQGPGNKHVGEFGSKSSC